MPLPPDIDKKILTRFEELIKEAPLLAERMRREHEEANRGSGVVYFGESEFHSQFVSAEAFRTKAISLVTLVLGNAQRANDLVDEIRRLNANSYGIEHIVGILIGLQDDYKKGLLSDITNMIEANIAADYMGQAEHLLGEGIQGQFDHVPAAVLAGAVLEDSLRRLCGRQMPPIPTIKPNGQDKMLNALIDDLKSANVYNELIAKQLRGWADIRNAAAHGRFDDFKREHVESMIKGIEVFLADYM
jgi:hypothetical protein